MVSLPFSVPWGIDFVFLTCFFGGVGGYLFYMWALYVRGKYSTTEPYPQPQMLPFIRILSSIPHVLMLQRFMHAMLPPDVLVLNVILSTEHEWTGSTLHSALSDDMLCYIQIMYFTMYVSFHLLYILESPYKDW